VTLNGRVLLTRLSCDIQWACIIDPQVTRHSMGVSYWPAYHVTFNGRVLCSTCPVPKWSSCSLRESSDNLFAADKHRYLNCISLKPARLVSCDPWYAQSTNTELFVCQNTLTRFNLNDHNFDSSFNPSWFLFVDRCRALQAYVILYSSKKSETELLPPVTRHYNNAPNNYLQSKCQFVYYI